MANKIPKIGDTITHKEPYFRRENTGKVIEILSAQFVYETQSGEHRFCLFKELWEKVNVTKKNN